MMVSIVKNTLEGSIEPLIIEAAQEASVKLGEPVRFRGWFEFGGDHVL